MAQGLRQWPTQQSAGGTCWCAPFCSSEDHCPLSGLNGLPKSAQNLSAPLWVSLSSKELVYPRRRTSALLSHFIHWMPLFTEQLQYANHGPHRVLRFIMMIYYVGHWSLQNCLVPLLFLFLSRESIMFRNEVTPPPQYFRGNKKESKSSSHLSTENY